MYWRLVAVLDFTGAAFNLFVAWSAWNPISLMNLLAAVVCGALGVFAEQQYRIRRASRAEDARIEHVRDNFPWL